MTWLKVGLNEWIVVKEEVGQKPGQFVLWTEGLIGCIGLTIITPNNAFLTHIYSSVTAEEWNSRIRQQFKDAIGNLGNLNDATFWITVRNVSVTKGELYQAVYKTFEEVWESNSKLKLNIDNDQKEVSVFYYPIPQNGTKFVYVRQDERDENPKRGGDIRNSATSAEYILAQGLFTHESSGIGDIEYYIINHSNIDSDDEKVNNDSEV